MQATIWQDWQQAPAGKKLAEDSEHVACVANLHEEATQHALESSHSSVSSSRMPLPHKGLKGLQQAIGGSVVSPEKGVMVPVMLLLR